MIWHEATVLYSAKLLLYHSKHKIDSTFIGPCIVMYSYNKSQRDALFLKFILIKNSTCFGQIYCPSSGVSTLYTAIGICRASYVDCLLVRSGSVLTSLADSQVTSTTNTCCCIYSVETPYDGQ